MVDDVLPGASLFYLFLSLESTVLPEPSAAHHDILLVLLLHREQSLELVLVRQGCTRACSWGSRHRHFGKYLLEMVSWDSIHIDGYWRTLPRTGMSVSFLPVSLVLLGVLAEGELLTCTPCFSLALPKLVVLPETTIALCNSTTAVSHSACA